MRLVAVAAPPKSYVLSRTGFTCGQRTPLWFYRGLAVDSSTWRLLHLTFRYGLLFALFPSDLTVAVYLIWTHQMTTYCNDREAM